MTFTLWYQHRAPKPTNECSLPLFILPRELECVSIYPLFRPWYRFQLQEDS
jgi:hypothetical protein